MAEPVVTLGNFIFSGIDNNPYLNELYDNILYNYVLFLFGITSKKPNPVNVAAALQFAGVLSKSTDEENSDRHKIWAQEIVALLKVLYPDNPEILDYYGNVLLSTENYLGLAKNVPGFYGRTLLDRFYTEFSMEILSIPAERDKQFFRSQKEVYDHLTEPYFSYSGPTSMGKSYIMRMFIKKQVMDGKKLNFAIIVPTKALINEIYSKIIDELKIDDKTGYLAERNYTIYYKVVDMLDKKQKPHIIFSSPNIPNPEVYLGLIPNAESKTERKLSTSFSPVSQIKILIDLMGSEVQTFNSYTEQLENVFSLQRGVVLSQIIGLINSKSNGGKAQSIVYFNSKEKAVEYALDFAKTQPEQNDPALATLASEIRNGIHSEYYLAKIITKGVAYHIGYLTAAIRLRIEELYRERKIRTLFCTSTLLEGV